MDIDCKLHVSGGEYRDVGVVGGASLRAMVFPHSHNEMA